MIGASIATKKGPLRGEMDGRECGKSILEEVRVSELCWVALLVLLLFQQPLLNMTGVSAFSYIDEFAVAVMVAAAAAKAVRNKGVTCLMRGERAACVIGFALFAWAFICNFASGVQTSPAPVLIDAFACSKFVMVVVTSLVVFKGNRLVRLLEPVFKMVLAVMVFCWFLNTFLPGGLSLFGQDMGMDIRYGIRSFQFLFGHPETMSMMVLSMMLALLRDRERNAKWIAVCLFLIASSFRSKGLAFVAVAAMFLFTSRGGKRTGLLPVLLCLAAAVLIGWDQFEYYYGAVSGARAEMTRVSFEIAGERFPFGTGFATFGSSVTAEPEYYSTLYSLYGLSNVQGLSLAGGTNFLSDTFWPTVLAQFGWLGLIGYVAVLAALFKSVYARAVDKGRGLICILSFVYLLILSTSGSAFFHPNAIIVAVVTVIAIHGGSDVESKVSCEKERHVPR